MTTRNTFYNKILSENEKAKHIYKNYDFRDMTKDEIYLLEKLSIISKYKALVQNLILKKKIPNREKLAYIQFYKANLSYTEYISYNIMIEENEESMINFVYIIGIFNFCAALYFVIKRNTNQSLFKDMTYSFISSIILGSLYLSYKKISYTKTLNELFSKLENRLFLQPDKKNTISNKNYFDSNTFEDSIDESF